MEGYDPRTRYFSVKFPSDGDVEDLTASELLPIGELRSSTGSQIKVCHSVARSPCWIYSTPDIQLAPWHTQEEKPRAWRCRGTMRKPTQRPPTYTHPPARPLTPSHKAPQLSVRSGLSGPYKHDPIHPIHPSTHSPTQPTRINMTLSTQSTHAPIHPLSPLTHASPLPPSLPPPMLCV